MNERFDYPLDYGIVLHSTCDSIWNEEVERDKGLMALRKVCVCRRPTTCGASNRAHFQNVFQGDEEDLKEVARFLAPYWEETREELEARFISLRQYQEETARREA